MTEHKAEKTVLITGAASGFGKEFVKLFAKDGYNLILTDKAGDLQGLTKDIELSSEQKVYYKQLDLSELDAADDLYRFAKNNNLIVTHLVNNAGLGVFGKLHENSYKDEHELLMVNVVALTELCRVFLGDMTKRKYGKILNVASIAGFQAGPKYATYFASKAFVLLLSEALMLENKNNNVTVTALCPGVSPTNFFKRAGMLSTSKILKTYFISPERVAKIGYEAMQKGKTSVIPGKRNWLVGSGYRILPRQTINQISGYLVERASKG